MDKSTGKSTGKPKEVRSSPNNRESPLNNPYLTGRGAQILNMVESHMKNDVTDQDVKLLMMDDLGSASAEPLTSTPTEPKRWLGVSMPSMPCSSKSILKRGNLMFEIGMTGSERKRVRFQDPPVSLEKEYTSHQILNETNVEEVLLQRRRNSESMVMEFKSPQSRSDNKSEVKSDSNSAASTSNPPKVNVADMSNIDPAILSDVTQNCKLYVLLDKSEMTEQTANLFTKFISKCISEDSQLKRIVLQTLCDDHASDFLDLAVKSNLSSVVFDRLPPTEVFDYVCAMADISNNFRKGLLKLLPIILTKIQSDADRYSFIEEMLSSCSFNDATIVNLISILYAKRAS